jgi:hypothetical protein
MTLAEKVQELDTLLEQYEKSIGLPPAQPPGPEDELQSYLSMPREQVQKLGTEDLGEIALRLQQFAFHIHRMLNAEKSRMTWAEAYLHAMIATKLGDYDKYIKFEIKVINIAKENEHVLQVNKLIRNIQQRIDRLESMAYYINNIANTYLAIQKNKVSMMRST